MCEWDRHVACSSDRGHINAALRSWHDAAWLQNMRLNWVSKSGEGRNTPHAGRLGTIMYGGQPQPRWGEGILLAEHLDSVRGITHFQDYQLQCEFEKPNVFCDSFLLIPDSPYLVADEGCLA